MATYQVFVGGNARTVDLDPNANLDDVRRKLGLQFRQYQFVYYNSMVDEKQVINRPSQEKRVKLGGVVFEPNTVIMANVSTTNPDFLGTKPENGYFRDRNLAVRVKRNTADGGPLGPTDFEPLMLEDVNPANPDASDFFADNLVICQKGTLVQFEIGSWGAAGFGYSIKTSRDPIVDGLFILYKENFGTEQWATMRRYEGKFDEPGSTIKIESLEDQGYSDALKAEYSKITIKSWRVTSWTGDGKTYSSKLQPPSARMGFDDAGDDGFFDGPPSGDTYVDAKAVQPAMPTAGKSSSQTIGTVDDIKSDGEGHVLGAVTFFVFVFRTKEEANKVMNVLNSKDPLPFPS